MIPRNPAAACANVTGALSILSIILPIITMNYTPTISSTPMRRLGQHFLKNKSVARKTAVTLRITAGETVIEIGPGHGELTAPLLEAIARVGGDGKVIAIERDRTLIPSLETLAERSGGRLAVAEGDALKALPGVVSKIAASDAYVITGNIPYYITGKLLRTVGGLKHKPRVAAFMVQKEVAERICAAPPAMNRLAASVQFWAEPKIIAYAPKKDFSPPPEVDSAVIFLQTKPGRPAVAPALYYKVVRGMFAQPRKTVLNNVTGMMNAGKERAKEALERAGIDLDVRPQNVSIDKLIALAKLDLWG